MPTPFEKGVEETYGFTAYLAADHVTPAAPTTPVASVRKDAGAWVTCTNAVAVGADGDCTLTLTAAEKTANLIFLRVTSANCDPIRQEFRTVSDWTAAVAKTLRAFAANRVVISGTNWKFYDVDGLTLLFEFNVATTGRTPV